MAVHEEGKERQYPGWTRCYCFERGPDMYLEEVPLISSPHEITGRTTSRRIHRQKRGELFDARRAKMSPALQLLLCVFCCWMLGPVPIVCPWVTWASALVAWRRDKPKSTGKTSLWCSILIVTPGDFWLVATEDKSLWSTFWEFFFS